MRPPMPDISPSLPRKSSFEQSSPDPHSAVPATFFLSRGSGHELDDPSPDDSDPRDSMYGVQSLDDAVQEASLAASPSSSQSAHSFISEPHHHYDLNDNDDAAIHQRRSTLKPSEVPSCLKTDTPLQPPSDDASCLLTPLNLSIQNGSLPSSPKSASNNSLKPLDDISITDDLSSQAVISGEEDNDAREGPGWGPNSSISQLVMPSIRMPSRRPFTERGKAMGRLKVVLAGASGSGKTSLINSVVQACEDIVHIDPFFPPVSSPRRRPSRRQSRVGSPRNAAPAISELYASTKPYPSWWSDLEDSRVLRRRKSTGDVVLERNLCFIDTPASLLSQEGQADAVAQYIQQQLARAMAAPDASSLDFQNMLAGNGGSQVDAILYLISEDTLATDIECMRKLGDLTNIVPVISKADLLSPDQIYTLKSFFHKQANHAGVKTFLFGDTAAAGDHVDPLSPFAVSSAKSNDDDTMDASTLMSPDYVQPLVPSELEVLVQKLFDRDNVAWMRHSAAKKLSQGRPQPYQRQHVNASFAPGQSTNSTSGLSSSAYSRDGSISPDASQPSYTLARVADHTQHEEQKAQVHLAKWAQDLQRSLQSERERYAALSRGDRTVWLTEQLTESIMDGSLVPITQSGVHITQDAATSTSPKTRHTEEGKGEAEGGFLLRSPDGEYLEYRYPNPSISTSALPPTGISPHDPLGLVWWTDDLKRRGWVVVQILGSVGVVGGLALWLARTWGVPTRSLAASEWNFGLGLHWTGCPAGSGSGSG